MLVHFTCNFLVFFYLTFRQFSRHFRAFGVLVTNCFFFFPTLLAKVEFLELTVSEKLEKLVDLLSNLSATKTIVVVKDDTTANFIAGWISIFDMEVMTLQGEYDQAFCDFRGLRSNARNVLVLTEEAARALDMAGSEVIIHYDLPSDVEEFVNVICGVGNSFFFRAEHGHAEG